MCVDGFGIGINCLILIVRKLVLGERLGEILFGKYLFGVVYLIGLIGELNFEGK